MASRWYGSRGFEWVGELVGGFDGEKVLEWVTEVRGRWMGMS